MDLGIAGRCAAVAGASAGLGLGSAKALAAEGVRVAICGRDRARIDKAAAEIGPDTVAIVADLSDPAAGARFVREAAQQLGRVDILVANAGGPPPGGPSTTDLDAYQAALDLSLKATIAMAQAAVPAMREARWGRIVAITSSGARQPLAMLAASSVARAGVSSFVKMLAGEVAADGVTVNSAQPGMHATDRVLGLGADPEQLAQRVPTRTLGDAEDFGRAVAFLCSESARFITGTSLLIDGGSTAGLP